MRNATSLSIGRLRSNLALAATKHLTAAPMTNAPTILVVEDEEDSVLLLESAFRKAQFSNPVHRVSHGALAMEYLAQAVAAKNRQLLELYRAGKAYHEPAPAGQK